MRAASTPPRRPFIRPFVWIAGLVFLITAVSWFARSPEPIAEKAPPISENVAPPANHAADSAPSSPLHDERPAGRAPRTGTDAAGFYKDAFALVDRLTDAETAMLRRPVAEADSEAAQALFEKIQPVMELLRRAAAADYCDWGFGGIDFEMPMPQINKAQALGSVALWNAAYRFPSEAAGAIGDLAARARLGHDVAETLLGQMVNAGFEKSANHLLRENASRLDVAAQAAAREFLAASTIDRDAARSMAGEIEGSRAMLEKYRAQTPDERLESFDVHGFGEVNAERLDQILRDPALFAQEVEFIRKVQAEMADALLWPDARFQEWSRQFGGGAIAGHPLAALILPSLEMVRAQLQTRRIEREMLAVGLTVLASGPAQVGQSRDPVTGRPFAYVAKAGGFELQSAFQVKGKPVTMSFGKTE